MSRCIAFNRDDFFLSSILRSISRFYDFDTWHGSAILSAFPARWWMVCSTRLFVIANILVFLRMGFEGVCIYGHASMAWNYMEQIMFLCVSTIFFFILLSCWMSFFLNTATAVVVIIKSLKAWVAFVWIALYFLSWTASYVDVPRWRRRRVLDSFGLRFPSTTPTQLHRRHNVGLYDRWWA